MCSDVVRLVAVAAFGKNQKLAIVIADHTWQVHGYGKPFPAGLCHPQLVAEGSAPAHDGG